MRTMLTNHFGNVKYVDYIQGREHSNLMYTLSGVYKDEEFSTNLLILQEISHDARMRVIDSFLKRTGV